MCWLLFGDVVGRCLSIAVFLFVDGAFCYSLIIDCCLLFVGVCFVVVMSMFVVVCC